MANGNKVVIRRELGLRGLIDFMVDERNLAVTDGEIDNVGGVPLSCSAVEDSQTSGPGNSDGQATVTPLGGISPYTYLWDNAETTATAVALDSGVHSVTVTDAIGQEESCNVTITDFIL